MEFAGKKGTALFFASVLVAVVAGFGGGWITGRQYPRHHYEKFGNSTYLFDTSTGRMCAGFPAVVKDANGFQVLHPNPVDQMLNDPSHVPMCDPQQ